MLSCFSRAVAHLTLFATMMLCTLPSFAGGDSVAAPSNGYGQFELRPVKLAVPSIAPAVREKFQAALSKLIDPTLMRWNEEGRRNGRTDTLAIEVTLTDMKFVGGATRFWIGPLAGSSHAASGRELAHESFTDASGAWAGAVTIGALDNHMISALANQMASYVTRCTTVCFGNQTIGLSQPQAAIAVPPEDARVSKFYDDLTKLDDLRKRGLLTEQEFQAQKKALLDRQVNPPPDKK